MASRLHNSRESAWIQFKLQRLKDYWIKSEKKRKRNCRKDSLGTDQYLQNQESSHIEYIYPSFI